MIKITNPVKYTTNEERKINSNFPVESKDWKKHIFENIKKKIKTHLLTEQNKICPYCGLKLSIATSYPDIEHIVPKDKHPNFMFEPKNLVVSCQPCNRNKRAKETLIKPNIMIYPSNGADFKIIHSHFDNYFDHIELIEGIVLKALTDKGKNTIDFCNLYRLDIAEERAEKLIINKQEIHKNLILRLATENDKSLITQINLIIERLQPILPLPLH